MRVLETEVASSYSMGKKNKHKLRKSKENEASDSSEDVTGKISRFPLLNLTRTRAVEIPCPTCPTWSHFIQDKLKISIYLSLDKYKCIT